jgi:ABC-2 type transport system permease protein
MINDTIAIYKKEMKTYFNSPIAFIIIAVFLIVTNWLFMDYGDYPFFAINIADIRNLFDYASIILLIVAPAISMRMVAEEKYTGTLELLVTMPISDASIILGKYFATLAIFFLILLGTLVTPITISTIGDMDLGIILSSYVGFFLLGASYLAIGMAASSFTKNQIIALHCRYGRHCHILSDERYFIRLGILGCLIRKPQHPLSLSKLFPRYYRFPRSAVFCITDRSILNDQHGRFV